MIALKAKLAGDESKDKPVPGLCDAWYIRALSALVIFFVSAACFHSYFRCARTCLLACLLLS